MVSKLTRPLTTARPLTARDVFEAVNLARYRSLRAHTLFAVPPPDDSGWGVVAQRLNATLERRKHEDPVVFTCPPGRAAILPEDVLAADPRMPEGWYPWPGAFEGGEYDLLLAWARPVADLLNALRFEREIPSDALVGGALDGWMLPVEPVVLVR